MKANSKSSKSWTGILCCAVLIWFIQFAGSAWAAEDKELFDKGSTYSLRGQWDKAIDCYRRLVSQYPTSRHAEEAQFWIGFCQQQSGDYSPAIQTFRTFAARYPTSSYAPQALYRMGEIYENNLNEYDKAIVVYGAVGSQYPASPEAAPSLNRKATIEEQVQNNFKGARQTYQRVLSMAESKKDMYPEYEISARDRIAFIQENSDNGYKPLKIYTRALSLEESGAIDKAIEGYCSIVKKYPKSSLVDDASFRMIKCWERKGVITKVREEGWHFLSAFPTSKYAPQVRLLLQIYR